MVDPVKLKQTLLNLLSNAKDAVISDSESPSIRLDADYSEHTIHISITDNGSGIDTNDMSSIFEPFVTHKKNGTGLGLAITRRIITAHGGSIQVKSTLGKGTVFTIALPVQKYS